MASEGTINRWWRVVGALLMNLSLGSLYGWSIFVKPLEEQFGWNREQTSWIFTVAIFVFGTSFVVAGRLQDKLGPFRISIIGSIALACGFMLASRTTSLTWSILTLGVVVGLGNGFGYATPIPVLSKWFPDKRGLAVGLAVAGYGAGSAILAFIVPPMLKSFGWQGTFLRLGIGYLVATVVGSFLLKNPPAGWKPEGWAPAPASKVAATTRDFAPAEMVRTPQFPLMWVGYALGAAAGLMTISQLIPFAKSVGLPATAATLTLLVAAVGNASGRIFSGALSDSIGRLQTLRVMLLLSAILMPIVATMSSFAPHAAAPAAATAAAPAATAATPAAPATPAPAKPAVTPATGTTLLALYLLIFGIYYCFGTLLSVFPSTTADFFGTKNLGVNYGWLFTAYAVAGIVGPMLGGSMFKRYQNYTVAFYTAGFLAIVALGSILLAKKPHTTESTSGAGIASVPSKA